MKVTKIVREFVEEEVNKKYPMPVEPTEAIQQEKSKLERRVEEAVMAASEVLTAKLHELGVIYPGIKRMKVTSFTRIDDKGNSVYVNYSRPVQEAWHKETTKVEAKRAKAIKDILVSLELGGTKKELMEMLANLPD